MMHRENIMLISTHGYVSAEPELGLPDTGGQVVYVLELSKSLARLGHRVDIYTRQFEDQPQEEKVTDLVRIIRIPCGGSEFIPKEHMCDYIPEWVENAKRHIRHNNLSYDVINSHYWDAGLAGEKMAEHLDIPHVHTPHSLGAWKQKNMEGDPDELEKLYNFSTRIREERSIYNHCHALVATSPSQRTILAEGTDYDLNPDKIHVIPPGYDDTRFFPVSDAERQAMKNDYGYEGRIVLALGRMAKNKGYDLLLRAMPFVFERLDDVKLLLATGSKHPDEEENQQFEELKSIARELGILDRVIFRHYIPDEELAEHYWLADVFALCSRYEPFGMTAVESMACGTPTVITTQGGMWQEVTWGLEAVYADPFDYESFGHAIYAILALPRVGQQLEKYGPQKARAKYTWIGIAQQFLMLLNRTVFESGNTLKHPPNHSA
mgnify:CR=1 FL=1